MNTFATMTKHLMLGIILCLSGCQGSKPNVPETVPTGNAIAKASAYVTSADGAVKAAQPHANQTGKAILKEASGAHQNAQVELSNAEASLSLVSNELVSERDARANQAREHEAFKAHWYIKAGIWLNRLWWTLVGLLSAHVVLRVAALFISGPVGSTLALISTFLNPLGWLQALCDNIYFRRKKEST